MKIALSNGFLNSSWSKHLMIRIRNLLSHVFYPSLSCKASLFFNQVIVAFICERREKKVGRSSHYLEYNLFSNSHL